MAAGWLWPARRDSNAPKVRLRLTVKISGRYLSPSSQPRCAEIFAAVRAHLCADKKAIPPPDGGRMALARPEGFEPPIFRIGICCAIQLRHGRVFRFSLLIIPSSHRYFNCYFSTKKAVPRRCPLTLRCSGVFPQHKSKHSPRRRTNDAGSAAYAIIALN